MDKLKQGFIGSVGDALLPKRCLFAVAVSTLFFSQAAVMAECTDPGYVWTRTVGGTSSENVNALAVDSTGAVIITGTFEGAVDFDPGSGVDIHVSNDLLGAFDDVFVTKLNVDGSYAWTRTFGGVFDDTGTAVAVDAAGHVLITGWFRHTVNFDRGGAGDSHASNGTSDIFVTKLMSDGSYGWTRTIGGADTDIGQGIAVTTSGDVLITGSFSEEVDFDPGVSMDLFTATGLTSVFILHLNADGSYGWTHAFGGEGNDIGNAVAVDANGNVFVAGLFWVDVDFNPTGIGDIHTSNGDLDAFVTKLSSTGSYQWTRTFGGQEAERAQGVAVDSSGRVFATGFFWSSDADFDPTSGMDLRSTNGFPDVFVTALNADGSYGWTRTFGGPGFDEAHHITVDGTTGISVTGSFMGTVQFDPTGAGDIHEATGGEFDRDAFVTQLNADGSYNWTETIGGATGDDIGKAIGSDGAGNTLVSGTFTGTVDFDSDGNGDPHSSNGAEDAFILKFQCDFPADDLDGDGALDGADNCPGTHNPDQLDDDEDTVGNACDNCVAVSNPGQADFDIDGIGDACEDSDGDGLLDANDPCPADPDDDGDADGHCGDVDNCPVISNPNQVDSDDDGIGDVCDPCPGHLDLQRLYWSSQPFFSGSMMQRAALPGLSCAEQIVAWANNTVPVSVSPRRLALDLVNRKIYWTNLDSEGWILRSELNGENIEPLVTEDTHREGIALDIDAGKMYWVENFLEEGDWIDGKIRRANLDGSDVEDVLANGFVDRPIGIAVDAAAGKLYWTDFDLNKIQRANLDGSEIEDVVNGVINPQVIALDLINGRLYWADDGDIIRRAWLDGTNIENVATVAAPLFAVEIAVDPLADQMYWAVSATLGPGMFRGEVWRADLDGTNAEQIIVEPHLMRGLAVSGDVDNDGVFNVIDNCVASHNPEQIDTDGDGIGDVCDACPSRTQGDLNGDGIIDAIDIQHFVSVLLNGSGDPDELCAADVNGDMSPTLDDVQPFVGKLLE
ncbi:MAG: thrombospondin type 3 repeat-containing protein [Phycisphaerales bacterium]|nr:thrombospondin type 3 repeat-containing protein [Phycisphaerales bacterium]